LAAKKSEREVTTIIQVEGKTQKLTWKGQCAVETVIFTGQKQSPAYVPSKRTQLTKEVCSN
jgi:hypothetical protein